MKKIILPITILILYGLLSLQCTQSKSDSVSFRFKSPINGYSVSGTFIPVSVFNEVVVGPATLKFQKDSITFYVSSHMFHMDPKVINAEVNDQFEIESFSNAKVSLVYESKEKADGLIVTSSNGFEFKDLNFDGKPELLVEEAFQGQRAVNAYDVYFVPEFAGKSVLMPETYEPLSEIDDMSVLDSQNKTLTIYKSGGACGSTWDVYSVSNEGEYTLSQIKENYSDDNFETCYEVTYNIINGEKVVVGRKILN